MDERKPDLRTLLRAQFEAERAELDGHPEPEALEGLQLGELGAEEERKVREHLSLCPVCADYVLALGDLQDLGVRGVEEVSQEELHAAWSLLRQDPFRPPPSPQARRPAALSLLAALLAIAVLGLTFWCWLLYRGERQWQDSASDLEAQLQRERDHAAGLSNLSLEQGQRITALEAELASALGPQINTPVVDLVPRLSRGPRELVPQIPPDAALFTLVIEPRNGRAFPTYVAELLDSEGRGLATIEGLTLTDFGNLTLSLTRQILPYGEIRLRLYGLLGGRRTDCGDYVFSIQAVPNQRP